MIPNNLLKYSVIENKKFKTVTMFIEADLDDYYLTKGATANGGSNNLFLDRSALYVLENKYDDNGEVADVALSGAISPYIEENGSNVPNFEKLPNIVGRKSI